MESENHPIMPDGHEPVVMTVKDYRELQEYRKGFRKARLALLFASGAIIGYGLGKL